MRGAFFILFGILILSSVGCTSVPMATPEQDAAAKEFRPVAGYSRIYLYRDEVFGGAVSMPVAMDGKVAGGTGPNSYFAWDVPAGRHEITSMTENIDAVTIEAAPSQCYYVWQEVKMGWFQARSRLHVMEVEKGQKGVGRCKLIKCAF